MDFLSSQATSTTWTKKFKNFLFKIFTFRKGGPIRFFLKKSPQDFRDNLVKNHKVPPYESENLKK